MLSACLWPGGDPQETQWCWQREVRGSHSLPSPHSQGPPHAHTTCPLSPREWIIFISLLNKS